MITKGRKTNENTTNEHNGTKSNNSNIVVKIGASNNNVISPIDGIDSSEESQKAPEKQEKIFSDESSSTGENLTSSVSSLQKKVGATKEKKKRNVARNNSKGGTENKKTHAKPTSRKRKNTDPTKQKSAARTSKVSKNNSTVQPSKRGRGRPRKKIPSESTPPDKSSISRKDPKQSLDIPLDTPTNLAGQYRFKPRTQVSIMAPIKKKSHV